MENAVIFCAHFLNTQRAIVKYGATGVMSALHFFASHLTEKKESSFGKKCVIICTWWRWSCLNPQCWKKDFLRKKLNKILNLFA